MIVSFLLKNIEIVAIIVSISGMGLYMYAKDKKSEDTENDLTNIIIENRKLQKSITDKLDNGIFNLGNKWQK